MGRIRGIVSGQDAQIDVQLGDRRGTVDAGDVWVDARAVRWIKCETCGQDARGCYYVAYKGWHMACLRHMRLKGDEVTASESW